MIVAAGHLALKAAFVLSLLQVFVRISGFFPASARQGRSVRPLVFSVFLLILTAFFSLMQAYLVSDFSVINVAQNSHGALPLFYKIAALWGNHEGSMLLFVLILSAFTGLFALDRRLPAAFLTLALSCQNALISAFLAFILFTSNPFLRFERPSAQGGDLNPLLQDIGLLLHPPLLYFGLAGFSVTFSFAITALIERCCDRNLGCWIRPWLLVSWSFLTLGIVFGSYWAYYELGWGGYWFWDPVENASLMPWLSSVALIHSCLVLEKRGGLQLWTLLLAIVTFSLSLLGTFLVRADMLISVHNFVSVPERAIAMLGIVIFFGGGGLLLFALRVPQLERQSVFMPLSREGILIFNNIFLSTACATILIGTLYPLIMEALWNEKISVGAPFFNNVLSWLLLPLVLVMPFGPLLGWKRADIFSSFESLGVAFAASLAVFITGLLVGEERASLAALMNFGALGLAIWLIIGALCDLIHHGGDNKKGLKSLVACLLTRPLSLYGRCLAHAGVGITMTGIIMAGAFSQEVITSLPPGHALEINGKILRFEQITSHFSGNYLEDRLEFSLWEKQGERLASVDAARRFFPARAMQTSEVGLARQGLSHYYIAAGNSDEKGALVVHVWYKSCVLAIWLGGLLMSIGSLLALMDKKRGKRRSR